MIPFKNIDDDEGGGNSVPPYGVMRCVGSTKIENKFVMLMKKPKDDDFQRLWYINGPASVPVDGFGSCFTHVDDSFGLNMVRYDTGSGIAHNNPFGPKPGEWSLFAGLAGFTCQSSSSSIGIVNTGGFSAAFFRQSEINVIHGILDGDLLHGSSQTLNIVDVLGDETGFTVDVHGTFVPTGKHLEDGDLIGAVWWINHWEAWAVDHCPVADTE